MAEVVNTLFKRRSTVPASDLQKLTESETALAQSTFNTDKITEIQNKFARGEVLLVPGRIFIREGVLWKVCRKRVKKRHFFLFNDVLVYGSIISHGHYRNQQVLPLSSMSVSSECHYMPQVEIGEEDSLSEGLVPENAFQINHANKSFHVYSHSKADKVHWVHNLNKQISKINQGDSQVIHKAVWVPDSASKQCMLCEQKFSAFVRKHHCRMCGRVVCSNCSPDKVDISQLVGAEPSGKLERVCKQCNKPFVTVKKSNSETSDITTSVSPVSTLSVPGKTTMTCNRGNESTATEDSDDSEQEETPAPPPEKVPVAPPRKKKQPPKRPEPYRPLEKRSQSASSKPPRPPPPKIKLKKDEVPEREKRSSSEEVEIANRRIDKEGVAKASMERRSEEEVKDGLMNRQDDRKLTESQESQQEPVDVRQENDYSDSSSFSSSSSSSLTNSFKIPLPGLVKKPRNITNDVTNRSQHDADDATHDVIKESLDVTEESHDAARGLHDVTEESHDVTEESHDVIEDSHGVTEESHDVTEDSHGITEESHDITEDSHGVTEESHDITEDSHGITEESHNAADKEPLKIESQDMATVESHDVTDESRNVTDEPRSVTEVATHKVTTNISTAKVVSPVPVVRKRKPKIISEEATSTSDSQTPPTETKTQPNVSVTPPTEAAILPAEMKIESPVVAHSPTTHARQRRSKFTTTNT